MEKKLLNIDRRILSEINKSKSLYEYRIGTKPVLTEEVLEEGAKEWLIGASMLISSILTPLKVDAKIQSIPPEKSPSISASIDTIINDNSKMDEITTYLHDHGYKGNPNALQTTIKRNAEKIKSKLDKADSVETVTTSNPSEVASLIGKGYVITGAEINHLIDTVYKSEEMIPIDSSKINGASDDFFQFGTLIFANNIKEELKSMVEDIISKDQRIKDIQIVSGTDYVRVQPGGSLDNIGIHNNQDLAEARAKVIKDYLGEIGVDTSVVTICTIPHNVENKSGYSPDESLRIASVEIQSIPLKNEPTQSKIEKINKQSNAEFELVNIKGGEKNSTISLGKGGVTKSGKTTLINKLNLGKPIKCPNFGGDPTKF